MIKNLYQLILFCIGLMNGAQAFSDNLYVVMLRPPRTKSANPQDMRSDPFWTCGSFGLTGCHGNNLLHSKSINHLRGNRIAFIQGGTGDRYPIKLVFITPPLTVEQHHFINEVRWNPNFSVPFKYSEAPLFIDQDGYTDFPLVKKMLLNVNRETWKGKVGSKFRTYSRPLDQDIADEIIINYESKKISASPNAFVEHYTQAMPVPPPYSDPSRMHTYNFLLDQANRNEAFYNNANTAKDCYRMLIGEKQTSIQ